jgi:hypothetical protein
VFASASLDWTECKRERVSADKSKVGRVIRESLLSRRSPYVESDWTGWNRKAVMGTRTRTCSRWPTSRGVATSSRSTVSSPHSQSDSPECTDSERPADPHPSPLSGTQDLISHFHLEPLYDTFLRPYLPSSLSSAAPVDAADQLSVGGASGAHPLAPPSASSTQATTTLPPVPGQVVLPTTTNNNRSKQLSKGAQIKATPASPAPSTPGPAAGGGLKITLGGIKLAGLTSPALATASTASLTAATQKKPKRPKMDKSYDYMVGDVLGKQVPLPLLGPGSRES